jgi:hypothetical protein
MLGSFVGSLVIFPVCGTAFIFGWSFFMEKVRNRKSGQDESK